MNVIEIGPLHYGNSNATISYINFEKQIEAGELPSAILDTAAEFIRSGKGMVTVQHHDDGCIDGRATQQVTYFTKDGEEHTNEARVGTHNRSKVAGGGYFTGAAMLLGANDLKENANAHIAYTAEVLSQQGIACGAHTGEHESLEGTDCGANDKFDLILRTGLEYADSIAVNVEAIVGALGLEYSEANYEKVLKNWEQTLKIDGFFEESNGQTRFKEAKKAIQHVQEASNEATPIAVSKRLKGDHKEAFIVANLREGMTFSQGSLAAYLAEAYPEVSAEVLPQAFVVDFPRIVEIAKALASEITGDYEVLLYAGIVYQFATAATLTDGTLRTFLVS